MPGFQSTRLVTEGALEPFFFLYTDDSIQGNPETCKQSSIMLNYEVKNSISVSVEKNKYNQLTGKSCTKKHLYFITLILETRKYRKTHYFRCFL